MPKMFRVTPDMEKAWADQNEPRATTSDISHMERSLGIRLPEEYVAFVAQYGFVSFGREPERRNEFAYVFTDDPASQEVRVQQVRYMHSPDELIEINRYMWTSTGPDDEERPMIPPDFVAVASDGGHGSILLELEGHVGRVWYWPQSDFRWGTEDNTRLGLVANNFADFINGLRAVF